MSISKMLIVAALSLALLGSSAAAAAATTHNILFRGGAQSTVELSTDHVVALDADGKPLLKAGAEYLFAFAKNPGRKVQEWDPARGLIRISTVSSSPVWLRCKDVKSMPIACGDLRMRPLDDGRVELGAPVGRVKSSAGGSPELTGMNAIPACPGDPRCPKM